MSKRKLKPFDVVPGVDVFGNIVNSGDEVIIVTMSYGGTCLNKGRYLGQRKPTRHHRVGFYCYIVEQNLVRRKRINAAGEVWEYWGPCSKKLELIAAIGKAPAQPTRTKWEARGNQSQLAEIEREWNDYMGASNLYENKKEEWLDANYPWKSTPYVRRSTLWLNKIIKL